MNAELGASGPSRKQGKSAMAELKLHDLELSGNCYKVRLFCGLLRLHLDVVPVDFLAGAHKKSPLIEKNPFGEIPILEDGAVTLRDSQAILVYLARKYGGGGSLPIEPAAMGKVVEWGMVGGNGVGGGAEGGMVADKYGGADVVGSGSVVG